MARIVVLENCEHGQMEAHGSTWPDQSKPRPFYCPGGSRRVLDPGSYVLIEKVNGEWPIEVVRLMASAWITSKYDQLGGQITDGLDALAGGEQP